MPGFQAKRNLVYRAPFSHFLQGLCFERSSSKESFYLNVFIIPLFVPKDYIYFTFGKRIGRGWNTTDQNIVKKIFSEINCQDISTYLDSISNLQDFVSRIEKITEYKSLYFYQAIGLAQALDGRIKESLENLYQIQIQADVSVAWQRDLKEQTERFCRLLKENPDRAIQQLLEWQEYTTQKLKIL